MLLTIDRPAGVVELRDGGLPPEPGPHDVALRKRFFTTELRVELRIGGSSVDAIVDSGSQSTLSFPLELARELRTATEPVEVGHARTTMSTHPIRAATLLDPVELAGFRLEGITATFNEGRDEAIVGTGILREFRLTIDQARGRARFEHTAPSEPRERHGLYVRSEAGGLRVRFVAAGSGSDRAGVEPGDLIVGLAGEAVPRDAAAALEAVERGLRSEASVEMVVMRAQERLVLEL